MPITQVLPLSPLQSPSPNQTTFPAASIMERSPSNHPLAYAPFRSSPLASSNTRATIRRISETGEMEMEDTEEMDTDDVFVMEDISLPEEESYIYPSTTTTTIATTGLTAIGAEGLFRAGTPTPVITPPFPQIVVPPTHAALENTNTAHNVTWIQDLEANEIEVMMMSDNIVDGVMEEEANVISTEELDTECMMLHLLH